MENKCNKKFDIPQLDGKTWEEVQESINNVEKELKKMDNLLYNAKDEDSKLKSQLQGCIERMSIELGLLDMYLGRTYTLEEVKDMLKQMKREKKNAK